VESLVAGREGQVHPAGPDRGGALHPTQLHTLVEVRRSLTSVQCFGQVDTVYMLIIYIRASGGKPYLV
jgi:hypothetical protein